MKLLIVFTAIVAVALAAPADDGAATVVKFENDQKVDGYNVAYETSNGISGAEQAQLKTFADDVAAIVVKGQYSYTGADGVVYSLNYVADENGFQPEGAHLPRV